MGTRGYRIWRHKRRCLAQYIPCDAYPSGVGMEVWDEVPKDPNKFEQWLQEQRAWAEEKIEEVEAGKWNPHEWTVDQRPFNDLFIEWIYELDLDDCVLHVDSMPMYNLRCMPRTPKSFLSLARQSITTVYASIPSEHRWDADLLRSAPPVPSIYLEQYASHAPTLVAEIVPPPPENATTKVRRRFAEAFVWQIYTSKVFAFAEFQACTYDSKYKPSDTMTDVLDILNSITLQAPTVFSLRYMCTHHADTLWELRRDESKWDVRHCWIRERVCVRFHPRLTDADNLHAGVARVVRALGFHAQSQEPPSDAMYYGVLNSITHCALVSYDASSGAVRHTAALALLPPWNFDSYIASSPGITALTSFCQHLDDAGDGLPALRAPKTAHGGRVPFDVLAHIASCIDDSKTLLCFAAASRVCKQAAKPRLMLPKLNGDIVEAICEESDSPRRVRCADGHAASLGRMWLHAGQKSDVDAIMGLFTDCPRKYSSYSRLRN